MPPGTIVRDRDRGHVLKDLTEIGQQVTVAKGGRGGRGNKYFATVDEPRPARIRARRRGRGALDQPGAEGHRRRRARRLAERRQVHAPVAAVAGPAGDRRLPVHDQVSEPRHRQRRRRPHVRHGRPARAHRGRPQRRRTRARVPAPRRTDAGPHPPRRAVPDRRQRPGRRTTAPSAASWNSTTRRWPRSRSSSPSASRS